MTKFNNRSAIKTVFYIVAVFFGVFLFYPTAIIIYKAFSNRTGSATLSYFISVFSGNQTWIAFLNSVKVSAVSALITTILAFILAYGQNFTNMPVWLKKIIRTLAVFPMLLPTITYGFAVIYSLGRTGLITRLFGHQLFNFYGFNGLVVCYVIYTLPVSFMLLNNTMFYIDKRFLIVTNVMGDNTFNSFKTAVFRPLLGTVAASFIQSFFLSFTDFGIPASIGGRYTVIAELLYNTMLGSVPDFNSGSVIALLMLLPSVLSIILLDYLQKFNIRYNKVSHFKVKKGYVRDTLFIIASLLILIGVLSIFAVIFIAPFTKAWPYDMSFTGENIISILGDSKLIKVFVNSLLISFFTALLGTCIVYACALITSRSSMNRHCKHFIQVVSQITNTAPGMVLGIAFLLAFKKTSLHNTMALIIFCNVIHFFSTSYIMMKSSLDKLNSSWETTARLMGDSWFKTVVRVITPNTWHTLLEVFCYYFINGMVTVSAVVFIASARTMVITTKIQELQHFARFNEIFVLSALILFTNLAVKLVKGLLNKSQS